MEMGYNWYLVENVVIQIAMKSFAKNIIVVFLSLFKNHFFLLL